MPELKSRSKLSWGKVINKEGLYRIELPQDMVDKFIETTDNDNMLVVFTPRNDLIRIDIFPVEEGRIIKIQLYLTQFSGKTIKQIAAIIRKHSLPKNLFTSGVCLSENECIYEAYLEENKIKVPLEVLKREFKEIENVVEVKIYKLEISI